MSDKVDDDIGNWIAELYTDDVEGIGDSRLEETRVQSPAPSSNVTNRMTGTVAERFNHPTAAKTVDMPGIPAAPKQVDSNPGLTPKSTIETAGHSSSSHNRSLHSTDSSNQSRRDTQPQFPADSAGGSSRVQTSKTSVSRSGQQLQLPKQNICQPSIHLFREPSDSPSQQKQQPKTKTTGLQPSQKSTSVDQSSIVSNQMTQSEESHRVLAENSSGSIAPGALPYSTDWRDQAYEQLQFIKEAHLADVMRVHKRYEELSHQPASGKGTDKYEKLRLYGEQILRFLQIPKARFCQYSQEEVHQKMKMIMWYIKQLKDKNHPPVQQLQPLQQSGMQPETGQLQQSGGDNLQANVSRKDPTGTFVVPQLSSQRGPSNSQAWPISSSLPGMENADTSLINLYHYGQPRSATQCASSRQQQQEASNLQAHSTPSRIHQTSLSNPPQIGSQRMLGKRASSSLPHGSTMNVSQNSLNTPLEVNSSAREMVTALDSIMRSVPSGPAPSLSPLIKQQERYQMMQAQKMKPSLQPGVTSGSDPRMVAQNVSDEQSIGQVMSHQRIHEQHCSVGQTRDHSSQRWVPSSTSQHHVASPQLLQPRPLVDSMGISLTKDSITSLQPTASPVIFPPSMAPLHMSSALVNSKTNPASHPLSLIKGSKEGDESFSPTRVSRSFNLDSHAASMSSSLPKTTTQGSSGKSHVESDSSALQQSSLPLMITPESSEQFHAEGERSSLPGQITLHESDEQSHAKEESSTNTPVFKRLIEMVQSASPQVLNSFAKDIGMVAHLADMTPGTSPYGQCREYTIDNSRYHWGFDEQAGVFLPHYGDSSDTKIQRHLSAMAPDEQASPLNSSVRDYFSSHLTPNTESSPASKIKRQKTKLGDLLLQEVTEINQKLIETTLDVVHSPDADKGTIVRFTYRAVGHNQNNPSMLPDLVLQVFVADDYPHSSPHALDPSPDMFRDNGEHKVLWENTMSKFNRSLRLSMQPILLEKMARTWDNSARTAILEFAKKQGGGSFTSTFGGWEDCS